ncbi:sigma 54-interacting transcriptional regulator [Hymenobacter terrenus]|uniref:sigma 54-interacting transcriptional regulator n=1 Tax=Hymenobacter terrenus TaxID=1629124 RepID=UPI0006985327|nr:sigma 54-interacting transcriptional regulator [Hymenobacter terrenus]
MSIPLAFAPLSTISNAPAPVSVLIVEDEFAIANDLRTLLHGFGYVVMGIEHSAAEALLFLQENRVGLVLLDIRLQGEPDGIELAREIRLRYQLPFVYISSHVDEATMARAKITHPYGFVVKPFKPANVQTALELAVYRHAYEDVSRQAQERRLLLDLSTALATVRDKQELFTLINERLRPLFGFDDSPLLYVVEPDGQQLRLFLPEANRRSDADRAAQPLHERLAINGFFGAALAARHPTQYRAAELRQSFPADWLLGATAGPDIARVVVAPLRAAGMVLGAWQFHYRSAVPIPADTMSLLEPVADLVALALSNILANEAVVEREREKSLQLAVQQGLTAGKDWGDKMCGTAVNLGQFLPWELYSASVPGQPSRTISWRRLTDGTVTRQDLLGELPGGPSPLEMRDILLEARPFYQCTACYTGPTFEEIARRYRIVGLLRDVQAVRSCICLAVPVAGARLVHLLLASSQPDAFSEKDLASCQRLLPQMALALEALFAFENLQQNEAEKAFQLTVNNALVSIKDRIKLCEALATEINHLVRIQSFTLSIYLNGKEDYRVNFRKQLDGTWQGRVRTEEETAVAGPHVRLPPGLYVGEDFEYQYERASCFKNARDQGGINSCLILGLRMGADVEATVILCETRAFAFTHQDYELLQTLIPQLSLALENLFAFEQIEQLKARLEQDKQYLAEEVKTAYNVGEIIGTSPGLQQVFRQIQQVAATDTTVLVLGESGTGKELVARAVHDHSPRRDRVLVKLNCAALPSNLIESELFGHEKGAFTGAIDRRIGKFELAHGGTIFLDEIGELPLELQSKLLRVLQEREIERLGGKGPIPVDVRVVAATNRDLEQEVRAGRFRLDLYYRLSVFPVLLPPLRDRGEDLVLLANHLAQKCCQRMGRPFRGISEGALQELHSYAWPGNIRELENLIEQAVILHDGRGPLVWGRPLTSPSRKSAAEIIQSETNDSGVLTLTSPAMMKQTLQELEKGYILMVLKQTYGRIRGRGGAAELLDIKPTTLEAKMEKLGIRKEFNATA